LIEKIKKGLMKATWKRPISMDDVERLIEEVEASCVRDTMIKSWEIGKW
jgi:transcriptional regulator NrdR family protein